MNLTKDLANIIKIIISEYDIDTSYDDEPYYGGFLYDISSRNFIIADRKIRHCKSPEFSIDELMAHRLEFLDRKVVTIKGRGWSLTDYVAFYPSHRQPHVYQEDGKKKGYYEQWVKKNKRGVDLKVLI